MVCIKNEAAEESPKSPETTWLKKREGNRRRRRVCALTSEREMNVLFNLFDRPTGGMNGRIRGRRTDRPNQADGPDRPTDRMILHYKRNLAFYLVG